MNKALGYKLYLAFICFLFVLTIAPQTRSEDFNVSTSAEFRAALLSSQSNGETDFINLAPGTYSTAGVPFTYTAGLLENFSLNITGSGAGNTELSGSGQTAVLIIDADGVLDDFNVNINIEDLTVEEGSTAEFSSFAGGLTILSGTGNVMIHGCDFMLNTGGMSGGSYINTLGQVSVSNSGFFDNTSLTSDGGGALLTGNFILLTDNLFEGNSTDSVLARGGGLSAQAFATNGGDPANGTFILNGNVFTGNDSEGHGGASLTAAFGADLQGNGFVDNTAGEGGAGGLFINVFNEDPGDSMQNTLLTELFSNLFQSNSSTGGNAGGAEVIAGVDIILVNNIFLQNSAEAAGGALLDAPDIIATNNTYTLNNANGLIDGDGGGMLLLVRDDTTAEIYNNIVFNNSAAGFGADIFVDDDTDDNQIGSTVDLMFNDFSDFFSVCENNPPCVPDVNTMGNIDRDPRFVDAEQGNVNLRRDSPARNAGDGDAPQLPSSDARGNPVGDPPDLGALQFVGGGGGGSGSCSLASGNSTKSGLFNSLALLILPLAYLLMLGIRRNSATRL